MMNKLLIAGILAGLVGCSNGTDDSQIRADNDDSARSFTKKKQTRMKGFRTAEFKDFQLIRDQDIESGAFRDFNRESLTKKGAQSGAEGSDGQTRMAKIHFSEPARLVFSAESEWSTSNDTFNHLQKEGIKWDATQAALNDCDDYYYEAGFGIPPCFITSVDKIRANGGDSFRTYERYRATVTSFADWYNPDEVNFTNIIERFGYTSTWEDDVKFSILEELGMQGSAYNHAHQACMDTKRSHTYIWNSYLAYSNDSDYEFWTGWTYESEGQVDAYCVDMTPY